jgi:hypothetical protein
MFGSTHSAFAFLPVKAVVPPEEITRMKQELKNSTLFDRTNAERKHKKLLEEWFDDEKQPQIE